MSSYVNIGLSEFGYNQLIYILENALPHQGTPYEIIDLVHLIDTIEEEYENDKGKQNKEYQRWAKQQKLLQDDKKPNPELFHKIQSILDKREMDFDFSESQFHCICDLIELFDEYKEKELQEYLR